MSARDEPRIWAIRDRSIVPRQRQLAQQMRAAPTEAERKLWWHLRHRLPTPGTHFRRQVRIDRYIVDFACHAKRVIVEVDGGQHGMRSAADEERTRVLVANGYRVLRYWNSDVLANINGVLEDIQNAITTTPTRGPQRASALGCPANPSPQGGGELRRIRGAAVRQSRRNAL